MITCKFPLPALVCALICTIAPLRAGLLINMVESGSDVVATLSGSIDDLTGTTLVATQSDTITSFIRPESGVVGFGPGGTASFNIYGGFSLVPSSYGTSSSLSASSLTGSSRFYVRNNPLSPMFLPAEYVLGTPMAATATYSGQSFASLGITEGTYVWSWAGDSVTLNIGGGPEPVPEPGTWAAAALLVGGAAFVRWRRRKVP